MHGNMDTYERRVAIAVRLFTVSVSAGLVVILVGQIVFASLPTWPWQLSLLAAFSVAANTFFVVKCCREIITLRED